MKNGKVSGCDIRCSNCPRFDVAWTYSVDEVQLPGVWLEGLEADGVGVRVEGQGNLDRQIHDHETLGAQVVRQDLDGVSDEQARPGERVEDAEDPDEDDHGVPAALGALVLVQAGAERPEDKGHQHAAGGGQEGRAAAQLVDEHGHGDGDDEGERGLAGGEAELGGRVGDAGGVVELARVVGDDGVAGPLGEDTEGDEHGQPVAVALGLDEVGVAALLLGLQLQGEGLPDLTVLELDSRVVDVAVGVVSSENLECLVVLVLGNQVTRRLRNPPDEGELD